MIVIREIDAFNRQDAGRCDGTFVVDARLVLDTENSLIRYTVVSTPHYEKRYPFEEIDYAAYIGCPDRTVFCAYLDDQIAGQIRLCRYWNGFACIEDLVVDRKVRRQGAGRELIRQAKQWAREKRLAGLLLETQDNNVGACRLYERCGFELAGFDRYLYRGLNLGTNEIALYWYWLMMTEKDRTCPEPS